MLASTLKHQETTIIDSSRTKTGKLVSDKRQTGWCYAKKNSEGKSMAFEVIGKAQPVKRHTEKTVGLKARLQKCSLHQCSEWTFE